MIDDDDGIIQIATRGDVRTKTFHGVKIMLTSKYLRYYPLEFFFCPIVDYPILVCAELSRRNEYEL